MYTLIQTARLNDVDPQAWLADVLARINDHNVQKLDCPGTGKPLPPSSRPDSCSRSSPCGHAALHRMDTASSPPNHQNAKS
jgi:hypothetical protein